jgi:hypothetical protein
MDLPSGLGALFDVPLVSLRWNAAKNSAARNPEHLPTQHPRFVRLSHVRRLLTALRAMGIGFGGNVILYIVFLRRRGWVTP